MQKNQLSMLNINNKVIENYKYYEINVQSQYHIAFNSLIEPNLPINFHFKIIYYFVSDKIMENKIETLLKAYELQESKLKHFSNEIKLKKLKIEELTIQNSQLKKAVRELLKEKDAFMAENQNLTKNLENAIKECTELSKHLKKSQNLPKFNEKIQENVGTLIKQIRNEHNLNQLFLKRIGAYTLYTELIRNYKYEEAFNSLLEFINDFLILYHTKNLNSVKSTQTEYDTLNTYEITRGSDLQASEISAGNSFFESCCELGSVLKHKDKDRENEKYADKKIEELNDEIRKTMENSKKVLQNPLKNSMLWKSYGHTRSKSDFLMYLRPIGFE
ncbi:unnamed protein product [Blepharisma stoltei]|uniref:Uncharacterized protein n=1 Tax=Blepharisma stoltei TaxID=1481888 RepID=A0AAU9J2Q1_9CILI|nr:unnamed protein product [Blepharisma stoltei]